MTISKIAILINFEYKTNVLPGASIDLYLAYKHLNSYGYDIIIFTDISELNTNIINRAIKTNIIDDNIYNFYKKITPFVGNENDLLENIKTSCEGYNYCFLYFSGHATPTHMIVHNEYTISFNKFQNEIMNRQNLRIVGLFDCCNCNGLNLPFILKDNEFRTINQNIDFDKINSFDCTLSKSIIFTSSNSNGAALACNLVSFMTSIFFKYLDDLSIPYDDMEDLSKYNRNLQRMCNSMSTQIDRGGSVKVNVYSSHIIDPVLWNWVERKDKFVIESSDSPFALLFYK